MVQQKSERKKKNCFNAHFQCSQLKITVRINTVSVNMKKLFQIFKVIGKSYGIRYGH